MSATDRGGTVLVVDDERDVADAYALRLEREYDVRTAYGGEGALEAIDGGVDVVLLDRRMPDLSGDEVLEEIRERGYDCGVIMVTAVDPDFDIVEMPFDDYLRKPVDRERLFEAIEDQIDRLDEDEAVSELFSVTAKVGVLEDELPASKLESHEEYRRLKRRADELRERIDRHGTDQSAAGDRGRDAGREQPDGAPAGTADPEPTAGGGGADGVLARLSRAIRGLLS